MKDALPMRTKTAPVLAGVMGWPVAHSRSPVIHKHWIAEYGLHGDYVLLPVQAHALASALRGLAAKGFAGCNLTIPHKVAALSIVDRVDGAAQRIGAINTIVVEKNGTLLGRNTDSAGFIQSLLDAKPQWRADQGPALVLGAGGAARAVVAGLLDQGATDIRVTNRTWETAQSLQQDFGDRVQAVAWAERSEALEGCALVVNSTSLGMHGQDALDLSLQALASHALVADVVYVPLETPLLASAQARGNPTVNGLGMLINQARLGFEAWFGVLPANTPALREKLLATF
jgi:shikimate dehydrogenase